MTAPRGCNVNGPASDASTVLVRVRIPVPTRMLTYTTQNSVYIVDEDAMTYERQPVGEGREDPSHRLTYGVKHPLKSLPVVVPDPYDTFKAPELRAPVLHIMRKDSVIGIFTSHLVSPYPD